VRLDEVLRQVVERFETAARENHIELEYRTPARERLRFMPGSKAWTASSTTSSPTRSSTPRGGGVSVTLSLDEGSARVEVSDTGIGIPEESLDHLFEEFFRAPNARARSRRERAWAWRSPGTW